MPCFIPVKGAGFALVDVADAELVGGRHWYAVRRTGGKRQTVYAESAKAPQVLMHRLILGDAAKGQVVDHINGDGLDNRRANLRVCSQRENARNRGAVNGYCGVSWKRDIGKWRARITVDRKGIALGVYESEEDAARAYDAAAAHYFGAFARLNFGPAPSDKEAA